MGLPRGIHVVVPIDARAIVILRDRDVDIGVLGDGGAVPVEESDSPDGIVYNVTRVRAHDSRAKGR